MKISPLLLVWVILLVLGSPRSGRAQAFSEEDLAATISHDSGHPEEGYRDYARSLARTLSMLNPTQVGKVFKGRGPLRKAEVEAAKQARDAAKESPGKVKANDQGKDRR
jgi:hypothetical protein